MKRLFMAAWLLLAPGAGMGWCQSKQPAGRTVGDILIVLKNSASDDVLVVAHRGDWRNAPENSLQAIQNCIDMGVDIVEIDVRKTQDGRLVLMHDVTLDRTTTGKGKVSEKTWSYISTLYLRNGHGHPSSYKVPTLEEALLLAKDKILVNLDKCYEFFPEVYEVLKKTGTVHQAIVKGEYVVEKVQQDMQAWPEKIIFMPIVNLDKPEAWKTIQDFQQRIKPLAFELVFENDTSQVLNRFATIRQNGSRVWVNTLWPELNAGHDDDRAVFDIPGSYDWVFNKGTNIVQTDRPLLMIAYLRKERRHP